MKIAIFGLGYVGSVSAACFCKLGHKVIGVDTNKLKVETINQGKCPIIEPGLDDLIAQQVRKGNLLATEDVEEALKFAEVSLVCVGTPALSNGQIDLSHVISVFRQIGEQLLRTQKYHVVALRSTILPDAFVEELLPELIKQAGKPPGQAYGVCIYPEFLREGTAIEDFFNPPKVVIGELDQRAGDLLQDLNKNLNAPLFRCDIPTACMVKYVDNSFHALKVSFANEIGRICKRLDINSQKVMDIFCSDRKLNISEAYLKPAFAFGGSCLPKDVRALTYKAKHLDIEAPVLNNLLLSNDIHKQLLIDTLVALQKKRLGFLGLSFKEGTDDLRESPIVQVIERMLGKGYTVSIFDENVKLSHLIGANRAFIQNEIPHISKLMRESVQAVVEESEVLVVSQNSSHFSDLLKKLKSDQILIDLVNAIRNPELLNGQYQPFC
ncbi:MAG: UDP-glucose dehydrogenase family protein [bacterium]